MVRAVKTMSSRGKMPWQRSRAVALAASASSIIALSWPVAAQTIVAPAESGAVLRTRLATTMDPPGRSLPADTNSLDAMLLNGNNVGLIKRLRTAVTMDEITLTLNWEQSRLYNGAGFLVAYAYMLDLWRLGSSMPATDGDQYKQSAGMMFLYAAELTAVDGAKCSDVSAPGHRRDQLFAQNRPIFDYLLSGSPVTKAKMGTVALAIEAATAPVRGNDQVLCSDGLDEISKGLAAGGDRPLQSIPNAPGVYGKTYAVPSPPGYKPGFVDEKVWGPKTIAARQGLPAMLTDLLRIAPTANAGAHPIPLTPDQKGYIVYHQCMVYAAIQASQTSAKDEDIFDLAKAKCASTRAAVMQGQETNKAFLAALDAADADKARRFPGWIKGVRERRKELEPHAAVPH